MTFQQAHENGENGLVNRRNLSETQLRERLAYYFSKEEIDEIILSAKAMDCWTDGQISIVCTGAITGNPRFVAVADGKFMKLIE